MKITVAVAQATPVVLDLPATLEKACTLIAEAGAKDARVLAFPETWIPVYPLWCDTGTLGTWGHEPAKRLHARYAAASIEIPSKETEMLGRAARKAGCAVVMGVSERTRSGTLLNAILFFDEQGELVGVHRKLVPTFAERLVWGPGDAAGLRAYDIAGTRVGALVCWEHWMPLPRQVLHGEGEAIHIAQWPHAKEVHQIASRHYAFEGRAFVLAAASYIPKTALPDDLELLDDFAEAPDVLINGGSSIIGPDAAYLVEPVHGSEALITAEVDLDRIAMEKQTLDTAGHYSRPDVFQLEVDRRRRV